MSNSIELIKKVKELEAELQKLKEELVHEQDEPKIPDFPVFNVNGEESWYINNILRVQHPGITDGQVKDYNYFHTKEYAQEFADKCKLLAMMLHCKWYLCRDFKENFEDDECKWYVYYANNTSHFAADYCVNDDHGSVYFDTEENAQKCADWLNEHWRDSE